MDSVKLTLWSSCVCFFIYVVEIRMVCREEKNEYLYMCCCHMDVIERKEKGSINFLGFSDEK